MYLDNFVVSKNWRSILFLESTMGYEKDAHYLHFINTWKYPWSTGYLWKIYQIPFEGRFDRGDSIFYGLVQRTKRNFISLVGRKLVTWKSWAIGGLKNIFYFGKDMGGNILWRCIFLGGLWSDIMNETYMTYAIMMDWLHHGR